MKVVILAGGKGTRLSEETQLRPKPMVNIGGKPILWHIMKIYDHFGFREFVVALGYKGDYIKNYFLDYPVVSRDFSVELKTGNVSYYSEQTEDWTVHLRDTGLETASAGRILRMRKLLGDEPFILTYGDGVANVDINELMAFHKQAGKTVTMTAVQPAARFGGLHFNGDDVAKFQEKNRLDEAWINGGFFIVEPTIFDFLTDDNSEWHDILETLTDAGQLAAYRHPGFWQCMDTIRDVQLLEELCEEHKAPWLNWE